MQGDALYIVAEMQILSMFTTGAKGSFSRALRKGRVRFDRPGGISVRGKTMYVSERHQIQVIRLPDDDS